MSIDISKILEEIKHLPKWDEQICLQGTTTIKNPFVGVGKVADLPVKEKEFIYPLFNEVDELSLEATPISKFKILKLLISNKEPSPTDIALSPHLLKEELSKK